MDTNTTYLPLCYLLLCQTFEPQSAYSFRKAKQRTRVKLVSLIERH